MTSMNGLPPHLLRNRLRGLYAITTSACEGGHLGLARAALQGGARVIQLRDKSLPLTELLPLARAIREETRRSKALFIVNDGLDLALAAGADGVHLGPDDIPVAEARRVAGPHLLVGASCGDAEEARRAGQGGADYIGAGDIFGTATKLDAGPPIGLEGLAAIVAATSLPVAAIGAIKASNIAEVTGKGASMACVISAIGVAGDFAAMVRAARELVAAAGFETHHETA